jgi:hypothetical protein
VFIRFGQDHFGSKEFARAFAASRICRIVALSSVVIIFASRTVACCWTWRGAPSGPELLPVAVFLRRQLRRPPLLRPDDYSSRLRIKGAAPDLFLEIGQFIVKPIRLPISRALWQAINRSFPTRSFKKPQRDRSIPESG